MELSDEQAEYGAQLTAALEQQERAFRRTATWKKIERYLTDRIHDLELEVGRTGLSCCDRAMLQGKIAAFLEARLYMVPAIVQETHAASPSPGEDVPASPRRGPLRLEPDLM